MPPKKKEEEAKATEEDPNKVLLKLHNKHADSACFVDMADHRITAEQRLMELRLEKLDEEMVELRNKRLEYWTQPIKQMGIHTLHLPEQHKHIDILELRRVRLAENTKAARCQGAHAALHQQQVLEEEMQTLTERLNEVSVLGPMLMEFCDQHAGRIARQRVTYLRRVGALCQTSESWENVQPLLETRLKETEREYALVTEGKRFMSHTVPVAIKDEEERKKDFRMAAGDGPAKAPEQKRPGAKDSGPKPGVVLPGRTAAEASVALSAPIPKAVMQLFLRWSTAHIRMQKRMQRFIARVQWLVYTQRYELLRRSKAILGNPSLLSSSSSSVSAHATSAATSKIPAMLTSVEKLNTTLTALRTHFNIEAEMETDNALAFAFEVKSLFSALHAVQTADTSYPPYDCTLVGATVVVPAAGPKASDARGKGGRGGDWGGKMAVLDTNFLKPCPWLVDKMMQPRADGLVLNQRAALSKIKIDEIDHILVAEMGAVLEDDLEKVMGRIDAQVDSHLERSLAAPDSEHGTAKALTQPASAGASTAAPSSHVLSSNAVLPIDRLSAFYLMRLLQTRQARRRLLGVMNYMVSIERRLVLDKAALAVRAEALAGGGAGANSHSHTKTPGGDAVGGGDRKGDVSQNGGVGGVGESSPAEGGGVGAKMVGKKHEVHVRATEYVKDPDEVMTFEAIQVREDSYVIDAEDIVRVKDSFSTQIMYAEAVTREEALRHEMMLIGTHYLKKFKDKGVADRVGVLEDLFQNEAAYYESLKQVLDVYVECYEHCTDEAWQQRLAQTMLDIMARRPVLDLTQSYFSESYTAEIVAVQLEASLMRECLAGQMVQERLYRNTIAVRHNHLTEEERRGFPCPLFQAGTYEELRGGQAVYYPTPASHGIGILDIYLSLESLVGVCDVLEAVVKELCFVYRLQAGSGTTCIKTVVLQQALIEWRLLLEEEDLTEELSKKDADEISRRPYANSFIVDDPFEMDLIVDQVIVHFDYEAELAEKKAGGGAAKKKTAAGGAKAAEADKKVEVVEPKLVYNELLHPNSMMQAYMNAIEAVLIRRKLLESIYESEVAHAAYRGQAAAYNRDMKPEVPTPIEFVHPSDVEEGGRGIQKRQAMEEVSALGADHATRLAMLEFDLQLGSFDFQTQQGLRETLQEKIFFLRKALRMQVLERGILAVALEYNQPALDRCMASVILKEDGLLGSAGGAMRAFAGGASGAAKKRQSDSDMLERNKKLEAEVHKFQVEEASRISEIFLDVRKMKKLRKEAILDRFNQRAAVLGQGRQAKDQVKSLKCELIDHFCEQFLTELEVYSLKGMISRTAEMLYRQTITLPKPKLLFTQNIDPQSTSLTQARALEESDENGRDTTIFSADLSLVHFWRLPHPQQVVEELPKESRTLSAYLDMLWSMHNLIQILTAYATVIPRPLVVTKDRLVGMDYVQAEIGKVRHAVEALKDKSVSSEVATFLHGLQNSMLSRYILCLQGTVYKLLGDDKLQGDQQAKFVQVVRTAIDEANMPLFRPLASFPAAMPTTAATQAIYGKMVLKGPLLHSPVPQPYAHLGNALMVLPEDVRFLIKLEWGKLDNLLAEALAAKNIPASMEPMLAMTTTQQMLMASRELDQMRARLCAMHSSITWPRNRSEYLEWIKVYEKEVMARMLKAKDKADREYSEFQAAALSTGDAVHGSAQQRIADKAQADYEALQSELAQRQYMLKIIQDLCCKIFLQRETDEALKAHAAALHAIDVMAIDTPVSLDPQSEHKGLVKTALSQAALDSRKEEMFLEFVHGLRQQSREVKDESSGASMLSIPKYLIAELLDRLAGSLQEWGAVRMEEALKGMRAQIAHLTQLLYLQERKMEYKEAVREREQQSMTRRIDVAVKDQCYAILFRMDELQRKLEEAETYNAKMEEFVREKLKVEFEDLVRDLQQQLTLVRSQFTEYREQLQQDMKSNLQEIKKEAMMKVVKSSSAPIELKRMTLKMAHTEDTIEDLTIENSELKRALLKVRTMNAVKDMSMKKSYDKRLQKMEADKLASHTHLMQDKEDKTKQMGILEQRLNDTNLALAAAEAERDKLRKELDLATRNKQSLLTWKVAKTQLLAELEARVKKYEKWSHHDVDKLLLDIEKKDAELLALKAQDPNELNRHRSLLEQNTRKELEKIRRQLHGEQRLKLEAFQKLDALRNDFKWEEYFESTDDKQSMLSYWKKRFVECNQSLQHTLEDNERLLESIRAAGLDVPTEIHQRRSATAQGGAAAMPPPPVLSMSASFRPQSAPVLRPMSARVTAGGAKRPASGAVHTSGEFIAKVLHETSATDQDVLANNGAHTHTHQSSRPSTGGKRLSMSSMARGGAGIIGDVNNPGKGLGASAALPGQRPPSRAAGGGGFYVRRPGTGKLVSGPGS